MRISFEDNSEQILSASSRALQKALFAIGAAAEGHAKEIITAEKRVDTGRMRNSITHSETEDSTYIGTNVEYAPYNELGTRHMRGIHFLQRSATENTGEYKQIAEEAYKSEKI